MPDSFPEPKKYQLTPRSAAGDAFEQNPLVRGQDYLPPADTSEVPWAERSEEERVREAVRRVIQNGEPIHVVARELHLSTSSIRAWKARYASFLQEHSFGETNPAVADETNELQQEAQQRFSSNWTNLLEEAHASKVDFKQDPLEVFLQTNPATGWLYDDEGKIERFTILGIFVVFVGIAAVLVFLLSGEDVDPTSPEAQSPSALVPAPKVEPRLRYDLEIDRAGKVVEKFLRANGYLLKLQYVRDHENVAPLVKEFYARHRDYEKPMLDAVQSYGMSGHGIVSVAFEIPSLKTSWFFNVVEEGKELKIDWFTSTLYQFEHISNFMDTKSTVPTKLHVQLARGNYYNYDWSDENKYQSILITFPGLDREIYGYVPKDSEMGIDVMLLTAAGGATAAIIEAKFPENAKDSRQVEITKLLAKEWIPF